jgi:hypothetical protein
MTSYDQSWVRSFTFLTMALADSCDPDENSRLLRNLFVMTFTWDPPTSTVRMIFDIPLFVRFLMMPYPGVDLEIEGADVIDNSCGYPLVVVIPHA